MQFSRQSNNLLRFIKFQKSQKIQLQRSISLFPKTDKEIDFKNFFIHNYQLTELMNEFKGNNCLSCSPNLHGQRKKLKLKIF